MRLESEGANDDPQQLPHRRLKTGSVRIRATLWIPRDRIPRVPTASTRFETDFHASSDELLIRTSYHEAGHTVLAYRFGRQIRLVEAGDGDGGLFCHMSQRARATMPSSVWRQHVREGILICLGGITAEEILDERALICNTSMSGYDSSASAIGSRIFSARARSSRRETPGSQSARLPRA